MAFSQLVQANLSTQVIGRKIEYYQILKSTNSEAWNLIYAGAQHGIVVITDHQTRGKGRGKNSWVSSPNNSLTFSVVLKPNEIPYSSLFSLSAGIAIAKTLQFFGIQSNLKWPNDILIHQKKVSGILCETKFRASNPSALVIGIGLNVNEKVEDLQTELSESSTSMSIESGMIFQRERVMAESLNFLEEYLFKSDEEIIKEWAQFCGHIGKNISFRDGKEKMRGKFIGLTNSGAAVVNINGTETEFSSPIITIEN
ncbi:MAG: biotin--[acetyl-CoA-carboxylase] ligase [Candidatus Marinimicrobia bacterium]|nr:biotin--[acetyl-CoA-carboxylase] ligase [Candidatus Neomarinimicrobiota bacterium]MBT3828516.1 biotin--[acetyl-CoA-carboxylase] ligase [Candidatus Neomarinimicrobiota bacterium]MBT3998013.1 biotin--[acetyl-CoA-carboxylase] ligase [Candidatus Neomarinimicrobiota bacterium]MBT4280283.1 biotin--[acetyl-CoA-carboxylase] ligase [Candidatus Neomarinimicrobiota bacterium]MBT4570260.1 biotin--[acetyl-CoA-carboxylase] ligase [Candidatus Neomarinimicrobiota bacterium]